jgi:hypothetical protein
MRIQCTFCFYLYERLRDSPGKCSAKFRIGPLFPMFPSPKHDGFLSCLRLVINHFSYQKYNPEMIL